MSVEAEPIVAYRTSEGIICTDPGCVRLYADLLITVDPMTQDDIRKEQQNRDGQGVACVSCMTYLDLWNLTYGAQS